VEKPSIELLRIVCLVLPLCESLRESMSALARPIGDSVAEIAFCL
jgi:hypothetical protein